MTAFFFHIIRRELAAGKEGTGIVQLTSRPCLGKLKNHGHPRCHSPELRSSVSFPRLVLVSQCGFSIVRKGSSSVRERGVSSYILQSFLPSISHRHSISAGQYRLRPLRRRPSTRVTRLI